MEFSEIGKELGGLTAEQVLELARFGKGILEYAGIFSLPSVLLHLIKDAIDEDEIVLKENKTAISLLLHIVDMANDLSEKCWREHKTPYGLTGVKCDNQYLGLKNSTKIEAA